MEILLVILSVVIGSIVNGWVLSVLWGWFIVPVFHIPSLNIGQAIGLGIVVALFHGYTESKSDKSALELVISSIFYSLIILGMGVIVHVFVG